MNVDLINRIGIILNFISAFLVAPELIGIQRLKRFEETLEKKLVIVNTVFAKHLSLVKEAIESLGCIFLLITGGVVLILFLGIIEASIIKNISIVTVFSTVISPRNLLLFWAFVCFNIALGSYYTSEDKSELVKPIFLGLSLFFSPLILLVIILWYGTIFILINRINRAIKLLSGEQRLRSIVVTFGIIIFTLGTLLQFLATF